MEGRYLYVFTGLQIVAGAVLFWVLLTWTSAWNAQRYVGTAFVVISISFIALARYQLGKSFSLQPEAHQLVTDGLYSKIRNPIYVFSTVAITGLFLVLQRSRAWVILVVVVVMGQILAPARKRVYWKPLSGTPTANTGARRGSNNASVLCHQTACKT